MNPYLRPRTPSPDIELGDLSESEGAAPENLSPELLDEVYRIRDPEPVQLNEIYEDEEASQGNPGRELLNESFLFRELEQLIDDYGIQKTAQHNTEQEVGKSQELKDVWIAYREYIQTKQRILTIEEQLQTKELLWFVVLPARFCEPQIIVTGALEELRMLQGLIDGQRAAVLHAAEVWAAAEP